MTVVIICGGDGTGLPLLEGAFVTEFKVDAGKTGEGVVFTEGIGSVEARVEELMKPGVGTRGGLLLEL